MKQKKAILKTKPINIRNTLQLFMFFCVFLSLFSVVTSVLIKKNLRQNNIPAKTETPGTVDIVFMGTSHVYSAIFPMVLYQAYGFTSINQGKGAQSLPLSYYAIRDVIEKQKPKLIVLDLYSIYHHDPIATTALAHRTIDELPFALKVECVIDLIPREDWAEFLLPITLYHKRWQILTKNDFVLIPSVTKGSIETFIKEYDSDSTEYHPVDRDDHKEPHPLPLHYIKRIIDLCRETDTELLFTVIPYRAWGIDAERDISDDQRYYHWMRIYADQQGVPFFNMLDHLNDMQFDIRKDMREWSHLNYWGGEKVTLFLGAYLQAHYGELLHDHRGKAGYESWEENIVPYNTYITNELNKID